MEVGNRTWVVRSGELVFIPAGIQHRMLASCSGEMHTSWLMVNWERSGIPLRFVPEPYVIRNPERWKTMIHLAGKVQEKERTLKQVAELQIGLLDFLAKGVVDRVQETKLDPRIGKALREMRSNLATTHNVKTLAACAGLSISRFHEVFVDQIGESPIQHLKTLRIRQAMDLLSHTHLPQIEIAERCGFHSLAYFSRCFRESTGTPPGRFRKGES